MSGTHLLHSYAHLDSPIHRAPASLKMFAILAVVTGVAFVPVGLADWTVVLLVVVLVLVRVAHVPLSAFLTRLALVQPFVLGVALLSLFQGKGLDVFIAIALKSTTCVAAVQL
ncbi:MAG: hypothetical protein M3O46_13860, partial [Myxococcota bacterium]|nr:hypothetical protein [Myxococcota bacterium]